MQENIANRNVAFVVIFHNNVLCKIKIWKKHGVYVDRILLEGGAARTKVRRK